MSPTGRTLGVSVLQTAVLAGGILAFAAGLHLSYNVPAMIGLAGAVVLTARIVARSAEPRASIDLRRPEIPAGRPFGRFAVLRERLRWGTGDGEHFDAGVRPVLVELVDDRLRRHHGLERTRQPVAARAAMGEVLWDFVAASRPERAPTASELEGVVGEVERL